MIFNDRQKLLDILYGNLKDKSKVLTKKRVVKLESMKCGVRVHTQDGDSFTGDMLIGADGVHSAVRKELWRLADDVSPGYFPKDQLKSRDIPPRPWGSVAYSTDPASQVSLPTIEPYSASPSPTPRSRRD